MLGYNFKIIFLKYGLMWVLIFLKLPNPSTDGGLGQFRMGGADNRPPGDLENEAS